MAAELLTRQFTTEIQNIIFPSNEFFTKAINDSAWVNNNSVELPHSGAAPNVVVNRAVFPGAISQRTDSATQYLLEEISTDVTHIQDSEALTVAYDKRASILVNQANAINDSAAIRCLYKWSVGLLFASSGSTGLIATTGTARAAGAAGATGTRLAATKADFIRAKFMLDSQNIPQEGRICVLPPSMYQDLLNITDFTFLQNFGSAILPSGVITRILGFDVYVRSTTQVYTKVSGTSYTLNALTSPITPGVASTDCAGALFYHPNYVRNAKGSVKVYVAPDRPEYYGTIMSAMVRFGALQARNDLKGIVAMVEG